MTAAEAATYSRLSVHTVRDAAQAGELSAIKTSRHGRLLFTTGDIDRWLEAKRQPARRALRTA